MAESIRTGFQETVECDSCEGTENVYNFCIQCPGNICDTCKVTHCNTRLTRNHRILPRTHPEVQQSRLSTKVYCKLHHDKEYVTFCTRCKTPCCPTCISSDHRGHTFSDLSEEIAKVEREMNEIASNFEDYKIPEAEKVLKTITNAMSDYKISADKVKQSAEARIQQIHEDVDRSGRQFMGAINVQIKTDIRQMEDELKKVQDNLSAMNKTADVCRTAPADASLLIKRNKVKRLMEIRTVPIPFPGFLSFKESNSRITTFDIIGQLNVGPTMQIKGNSEINIIRASTELKDVNIEIESVHTIHHQSGGRIIHSSDGQTWISDNYTEKIKVFDEHFKVVHTKVLRHKLIDMAFYENTATDKTVIATTMECKILEVGTHLLYVLKSVVPETAGGVCVNNKQEVIVGLGVPWRLAVYSYYGFSLLKEIEKDENDKQLFSSPIRRVRQTMTGDYLVASGPEVICFSIDWKMKWRCKLSNDVWALCCDRLNNILVIPKSTNTHGLSVISCVDGKIKHYADFQSTNISNPLSLSVDRNGLLWVGQEKKVTIIRYLKQ